MDHGGTGGGPDARLLSHALIALAGALYGSFRVFDFGTVIVLSVLELSDDGKGATVRHRNRLGYQSHLTPARSSARWFKEGHTAAYGAVGRNHFLSTRKYGLFHLACPGITFLTTLIAQGVGKPYNQLSTARKGNVVIVSGPRQ